MGSDGRLRVAVIMGGCSTEREISLMTGRKVAEALDPEKYTAIPVIVDDHAGFVREAAAAGRLPVGGAPEADGHTDVAFIALHGAFGEDGTIQAVLGALGIPYTGSRVLASALAMDKAMAKRVFTSSQIPTPRYRILRARDIGEDPSLLWPELARELGVPMVVKPNGHGSSVGVSIVRRRDDLPAALASAAQHDDIILVERCIEGTEISVGIVGNEDPQAFPVVEIVPQNEFYDYEAKYTPGATEEICPARIPREAADRALRLSLAAHKVLGCRGMSRVDMILSGQEIWVLEVNTIPGMTETSLLPFAAKTVGVDFPQLVDRLVQLAVGG